MKNKKLKILYIIPTLTFGGAERVLIYLSQNISKIHFNSELIVIGNNVSNGFDELGQNVTYLNSKRVIKSIPKLIKTIKQEKPDIVLGTLSHLNVILGVISILFPKIIFIGRQTSIAKVYNNIDKRKKSYWYSFFFNLFLNKLDFLICQSRDMANDCIDLFGFKKEKIKILHNPITDSFIPKDTSKKNSKSLSFITVGRLVEVKGHIRILKILSKINIPFSYTIIGDGPLREEILSEAKNLNIDEKINHIPYTNKVADYLSESDCFLQGSLSEGFPNALLESCAVGTPAIAFDVPGGTKEIVENGINGFLVKTENEFINHLNNLPDFDPKTVSDSVYKKFDKKIILNNYEEFFKEIVKRKEVAEKH